MFGQLLVHAAVSGTQVLFFALALYAIYAVSRSINLALGGIAAAVAYAFYFSFTLQQWPLAIAVFFSAAVAVILGGLNYLISERLTIRQQYLLILIASFSFASALEAIIPMIFGSDAKSLTSGIIPNAHIGSYELPVPGLIILIAGATVVALGYGLYQWTAVGRKLRAVSEQHFVAMSLGINQPRLRLIIYTIAALIAGGIGLLSGLYTAVTPNMGFQLLVIGFMALLVGGAHDLRGTVIASYLLVVITDLVVGLTPAVSSSWRLAIVFLIAATLLSIRPHGLFTKQIRMS